MGERIAALDEQAKALDEQFRELLAGVPNMPHESVPVGKSAEDNVEVRRWGTPPRVRFRAQSRIGIWARNWAFWISSAPPKSPARALPSIGAWARSWSAR